MCMYIYIYMHLSLSLSLYIYIYIYIYIYMHPLPPVPGLSEVRKLGHRTTGRSAETQDFLTEGAYALPLCAPTCAAPSLEEHLRSSGMWCLRMWCLIIIDLT